MLSGPLGPQMTAHPKLATTVRVTLVVGAGLLLAPLLILLDGAPSAPPIFRVVARAQIVLGGFVVVVGLAFSRRKAWARPAAIALLNVGACAAIAWWLYMLLDIGATASSGFIALSLLVTGVWVAIFRAGVAFLKEPALVAELEGAVQ